jgi:FkbM family methyltransferase
MFVRKIKNYFRNKAWLLLKAKWKLRSGIMVSVENDSDWFVFNEIFTNKEYDRAFDLFLPLVSARPTIFDLGANVGYFTLRVADELALAGISDYQIISVEASPENFAVLQKRVGQEFAGQVKIVSGLVGHKTGSQQVVNSQQHYGHSAAGQTALVSATEVDYVDVEGLLDGETKIIDLLKCDIEGSEEIFLAAYPELLLKVSHAVFEFHDGACNVDHCRRLLKDAGLTLKGVIKEDPSFKTSVEVFSRY